MWIVNSFGFLSANYILEKKLGYNFSKTLPVTISFLTAILFILSLFGKIMAIDYIFAIINLLFLIGIITKKIEIDTASIFETLFLIAIGIIIFVLTKEHLAHTNDELCYWALETKTIFALDGFAEKGKDAAYLYGDYHPGVPLFLAWVCRFKPDTFSEGLMYGAYWFLFAVPIISVFGDKITKKNILLIILLCLLTVFLVPSIVNRVNYEGITAELPISSFFALLLTEVMQRERVRPYYLGAITFMMISMKPIAIVWVVAAFLFGYVKNRHFTDYVIAIIPGIFFVAIWKVYCHLLDKTSYFFDNIAATIREIQWGGITSFLEEAKKYLISFCTGFVTKPLHTTSNAMLNLAPVAFVALFILIILFYKYKKIVSSKDSKRLICGYLILNVCVVVLSVFMCTFIFREPQYYDSSHMVMTFCSRYAAPLYLGALLVLLFLIIQKWEMINFKIYEGTLIALLLLCVDYSMVYKTIINPSEFNQSTMQIRTEIDEKYPLLNKTNKDKIIMIANVAGQYPRVICCHLRLFVAPKQVIYEEITAENLSGVKEMEGAETIFYGFNE